MAAVPSSSGPPPACLSRRGVLRRGVGAALLAPGFLLAGCSAPRPLLLASRGEISGAWARRLPSPWKLRLLEGPGEVIGSLDSGPAGLLQLSDGWALTLPPAARRSFGQAGLLARLAPMAAPVSRLYAPDGSPALAFPWSFSPWVLLLRSRPDLEERARQDWQVLLDPSLRGRLVLPSSPRVVIDLVGADPERLQRLRAQALAFDDRDGLSLLLSGRADAAVLPRHRVVSLLRRDLRLRAVLPATGAPLSWNLLLQVPGTHPPIPEAWLVEVLQPPLLRSLLLAGWVPPLPRQELAAALSGFPAPLASLLVPPEPVLARCRSLPPLTEPRRQELQRLWEQAAPPSGAPA